MQNPKELTEKMLLDKFSVQHKALHVKVVSSTLSSSNKDVIINVKQVIDTLTLDASQINVCFDFKFLIEKAKKNRLLTFILNEAYKILRTYERSKASENSFRLKTITIDGVGREEKGVIWEHNALATNFSFKEIEAQKTILEFLTTAFHYLLLKGANVALSNADHPSDLCLAIRQYFKLYRKEKMKFCLGNNSQVFLDLFLKPMIIHANESINVVDQCSKKTPIMLAAHLGLIKIVSLLRENGAKCMIQDEHHNHALNLHACDFKKKIESLEQSLAKRPPYYPSGNNDYEDYACSESDNLFYAFLYVRKTDYEQLAKDTEKNHKLIKTEMREEILKEFDELEPRSPLPRPVLGLIVDYC